VKRRLRQRLKSFIIAAHGWRLIPGRMAEWLIAVLGLKDA